MASSTIMARSSGARPSPTLDLRKARTSAGLPESTSANAALGTMSSPYSCRLVSVRGAPG